MLDVVQYPQSRSNYRFEAYRLALIRAKGDKGEEYKGAGRQQVVNNCTVVMRRLLWEGA
jgi:hypothetical protein